MARRGRPTKAAALTEAEQDEVEEASAERRREQLSGDNQEVEGVDDLEAPAAASGGVLSRRGKPVGGSGPSPKGGPAPSKESLTAVVVVAAPAVLQRNTNSDGLFEPLTTLTVEQHNVSILITFIEI